MSNISNNSGAFFLVIEGLDGSGKTEIARQLTQVLEATIDNNVKLTFEPHDPSCSGLFIRQVLKKNISTSPRTLALAFATNRADHCNREISPFLSKGAKRIVVCDRYYLSSLVYQTTSDLSMEDVMSLNNGVLVPDLTIFLHANPQTCYERMRRRPEDKELFEKNLGTTLSKYRTAIEFLRERGETIVEVDANNSMSQVLSDIASMLTGEHGPGWLSIQSPLPIGSLQDVFSLNGGWELKIGHVARELYHRFFRKELTDDHNSQGNSADLREVVYTDIGQRSINDIGSLFIDFLTILGYGVIEKLPWTDLYALELEYNLPPDLKQRGTALLLSGNQRYDTVTKKVLDIEQLSDFMFILDPRSAQLVNYYERDLLYSRGNVSMSPTTRIVNRSDIADVVLATMLHYYLDERIYSLHLVRPQVNEWIEKWELSRYWDAGLVSLERTDVLR